MLEKMLASEVPFIGKYIEQDNSHNHGCGFQFKVWIKTKIRILKTIFFKMYFIKGKVLALKKLQ